MNKLSLRGRIWIASDVHLGPDAPATAAAFQEFLEEAGRKADTLILAGDIFDAWIGDDVVLHDPDPWLQAALSALRRLAGRIPLWLGRGNRDFLLGADLARHVGARLLPETALLDTDAGLVLLVHGDEYCIADHGYQRFRRTVRRPGVQRLYLALPLRVRKGIAAWARHRSMHANRYKAPDIMDVDPGAVVEALRQSGARLVIHGHTHRPGRHALQVDGQPCERLVLPDWDFDHAEMPRGGWASVGHDGVQLCYCPARPAAN
ncbi:MAG: UDP-2,3-diacylglucosamine diphosphatase [Burkholderiaceae bacterium]